jgi:hypothetical protein
MGGDDMEVGMQEPGDMRCCGGEERGPAVTERKLKKITGMHEPANPIIISNRRASYSF